MSPEEERTSRSIGGGSRTVSRSSRPSDSTTGSTSRARPATVDDFEADSSEEAIPPLPASDGSGEVEDEDDKTDAMTVNTDMIDDIQQYDIVQDSSQESAAPAVAPARNQVRDPDEFDELANDGDIYISDNKTEDDDDDFEVVSHVKKETKNHGHDAERTTTGREGKGKAPVKVDPDEPPENLLASFGELSVGRQFVAIVF